MGVEKRHAAPTAKAAKKASHSKRSKRTKATSDSEEYVLIKPTGECLTSAAYNWESETSCDAVWEEWWNFCETEV